MAQVVRGRGQKARGRRTRRSGNSRTGESRCLPRRNMEVPVLLAWIWPTRLVTVWRAAIGLRASLKWARLPMHAPAASRGRHTDISLTMPPKRAKKTEGPVEEPAKAAKRAKASAPAASKTLTIEACKS